MKKYTSAIIAVIVLAAVFFVSFHPKPVTPSEGDISTTDWYTHYLDMKVPIWTASPVSCTGGASCIEPYLETCTPVKTITTDSFRDNRGVEFDQTYEVGIQGIHDGRCKTYIKILDRTGFYKIVEDSLAQGQTTVVDDQNISNYFSCYDLDFTNTILSIEGLPHSLKCYHHTVFDPVHRISKIGFMVVQGEGMEDASQNFRVIVQKMLWGESATFFVEKDGKQETVNVGSGNEKNVLGYKIRVIEFGEKNVQIGTDKMVMTPGVSFTVSE